MSLSTVAQERATALLDVPHDGRHGAGPSAVIAPPVNALRQARREAGLSLSEFARAMNVSVPCASRWETARRRPHSTDLARIADVLDQPLGVVRTWFAELPVHGAEALSSVPGLRRLRRELGLDRRALAGKLGVTSSTIANWESGRRPMPARRLSSLAAALEMPVPVLLRELRKGEPPRRPRRLRLLRQRAGFSQTRVAKRLGISNGLLARWEAGLAVPRWPYIRQLAALYGCSVAEVAESSGCTAPELIDVRRWQTARLGDILHDLRKWRGESLREIADRVGVHWQTLRRWERGLTYPPPEIRAKLEEALGLAVRLPLR